MLGPQKYDAKQIEAYLTNKWLSFLQMVLALRYLHCDKGIVHRDLTPNNIMLGDYDKVTLSKYTLDNLHQILKAYFVIRFL